MKVRFIAPEERSQNRMVLAAFVVITIAVILVLGIFAATNSACLRLGYAHARIDWTLSRYCVTRVNQTDIVVPLSEARPR